MKYDLDSTFGEIFDDDPKAFLDQLIDIQKYQASRDESERWAKRLRFIDISSVPDLTKENPSRSLSYSHDCQTMLSGRTKPLILPLLEQEDEDEKVPYMAVSWKWTKGKQFPQWGCDIRESFNYMIQRPGKEPHKSKFPDHYLERVIMYAQSEGIDRLWIDKECIYQEPGDDPKDLNLGVQIMDVVYGESTLSVGLLTTPLMRQNEINLLAELLSGTIFQNPNDTEKPTYKWHTTLKHKILETQMLILRLLNDSRWSRGWIFQEDHLSSDRMTLLIPYTDNLKIENDLVSFGTLQSNLCVKLTAFQKAVTMFWMASHENRHRWPFSEMLRKAKQYEIYNKDFYSHERDPRNKHGVRLWTDGGMGGYKMNTKTHYFNESTYPSTVLSILDDTSFRDLEKVEDRVAVMANAAKFSTRLDISDKSPLVASDMYSLSAIFLAMFLLNGEILNTCTMMSFHSLMGYTLRGYLEEMQYKFRPPLVRYQQNFINRCRLNSVTINTRGVETKGILFRVLPNRRPFVGTMPPSLKLSVQDRRRLDRLAQDPDSNRLEDGRRFHDLAREVIMILNSKLRKKYGVLCKLADLLERYLHLDHQALPQEEQKPSTLYALDMMAGLVQALIDDRELRLARLESEPESAQPSAIFISPYQDEEWMVEQLTGMFGNGVRRTWVFTSFDGRLYNHGMERLASIEVAPCSWGPGGDVLTRCHPDQTDDVYLRSYGWINGVWDIEDEHMGKYTFPITGLTTPQPRPIEEILGKYDSEQEDDTVPSGEKDKKRPGSADKDVDSVKAKKRVTRSSRRR